MNFDMTTPCSDCPFRKTGGIKLHPGRIHEIGEMMLSPSGGTFSCHRTVEHDDCGEPIHRSREQHCAGALLFSEAHGNATQMMRISERFGGYDHTKLDPAAYDLVWASLDDWIEGGSYEQKLKRKRMKKVEKS